LKLVSGVNEWLFEEAQAPRTCEYGSKEYNPTIKVVCREGSMIETCFVDTREGREPKNI